MCIVVHVSTALVTPIMSCARPKERESREEYLRIKRIPAMLGSWKDSESLTERLDKSVRVSLQAWPASFAAGWLRHDGIELG